MKRILLTSLLITINAYIVIGQDTVIFRKDVKETPRKKRPADDQNIVKLAPLAFISGNIPVYFEREITPWFGMQVGVGITSKNYVRDIFSGAELSKPEILETKWNDGSIDTYADESIGTENKNRKYKSGFFVAAEPRIFFESEGLEGTFIGLSYSRGKYNSTSKKVKAGASVNGDPVFTNSTVAEFENISDLMVTFGSQTIYDRITLEYSTGVGLRKINGEKYAYGRNFSGDFVDGISIIEKTKIAFNFSLKVGYHF